ncbi:hypothetical protein F5148DRAFT_972145 [Russula earlei]|uniref:Uncharacterized protein n=1 Tax=Russula earlei TaxID=71964 RepID=A0ACC0UNX0_9AGAM|nr:hypothetical protein F5148DRAFT_972145 [Russula earlei]
MKRPRKEPSNTTPPSWPSGSTEVSKERPPAKRVKAGQACTSCRKHKTRCEWIGSASYLSRCHRCDVLSISCSFETNVPTFKAVDESPVTIARQRILKTILSAPQSSPDECLEQTQSEMEMAGSNPRTSATPTSPWEFLKVPGIPDWTATPMLAMLTLSKMACKVQPTIQPMTNLALADVLTGDERRHLLNIFESRYAPWLSLPPGALGEDPVLNLIRCTVASRHLEPSMRANVFPTLRRLTEEAIMKHIFNPRPSPAIIQAFSLLALWSPFDTFTSSSSETHDSRLIAAAAVNMCSSLRFDQAATDEQVLEERRKLGAELSLQEEALLTTVEQRKVLWTCVHNVESIVCIGTGRGVSSKATSGRLVSLSPLNLSTLADARRTRMSLASMIFDLTESALRLEMTEDHNKFETFCDESAEILWRFDGLQRVITSIHVATDVEVFYAHMLVVNFYFCRLTFLIHTLRNLRMHIPPATIASGGPMFFSSKIARTGCGYALACARDALASAEALLTTILSIKEEELLATAPDSVFAMISFAAAHLTTSRFLILQSKVMRHLPGVSEQLLERTVKCLHQISLSTDDNASRCAHVVSRFLDTWNEKQDDDTEVAGESPNGLNDSPLAASSQSPVSNPRLNEYANSECTVVGPSPGTASSLCGYDFMFNPDQDALLGLDFWQYLAEVPNAQPDSSGPCE